MQVSVCVEKHMWMCALFVVEIPFWSIPLWNVADRKAESGGCMWEWSLRQTGQTDNPINLWNMDLSSPTLLQLRLWTTGLNCMWSSTTTRGCASNLIPITVSDSITCVVFFHQHTLKSHLPIPLVHPPSTHLSQ